MKLKLTVTDTPGFGDQINNDKWWVFAGGWPCPGGPLPLPLRPLGIISALVPPGSSIFETQFICLYGGCIHNTPSMSGGSRPCEGLSSLPGSVKAIAPQE